MDTRTVASPGTGPGAIPVTLEVNGAALSLPVAPYVTLQPVPLRGLFQHYGRGDGRAAPAAGAGRMNRFDYERATDVAQAVGLADQATADAAASAGRARFLAGGTNLVDLMKEDVEWPRTLIDVNRLPLRAIEELADGGLRLGALATNAETADHPVVRARYPVLSAAILSGATRQLRNAATNGGNLNQRTRCCYFYDTATPCNKRAPGTGCGALGGCTRMHAILGASAHCVATNPSDMAVALAVLDARVRVTGPQGERLIPLADYHRLPDDEPWRDNNPGAAELVTAVDLPPGDFSPHYTYLKLRDRLWYAFALVSVAAVLARDAAGRCAEVRIALGGVAHKPWRVPEAEALLRGGVPERALFEQVAARMLVGAAGLGDSDFKSSWRAAPSCGPWSRPRAAGRIINPKTARSQVIGGAVMAIGMALHEESVMDHRLGRFMTHNFADYHIPVNADIPHIDVISVDEPDTEVSPLGVKGVGEIGVVGTAAAVVNAIHHATGQRVRSLPVTVDKLLG